MPKRGDYKTMGSNDLQSATNGIWGGGDTGALDTADLKRNKRERIEPLAIDNIYPDAQQPRRAVPSELRPLVDPANMLPLFDAWLTAAQQEQGVPIDIAELLTSEQDPSEDAPTEAGPRYAALMALVALAASIRREGLANPITVVERGGVYQLETGERRWLAYHLLHAIDPAEPRFERIESRIVPVFDVWRQASENNTRADLNAIGKARQLALLLMNLHGEQHFKPFDAFEVEQEFYAQVADGNTWRVPRGTAQRLLTNMGFTHPVQLRQYRALLRLPLQIWLQADDENWPEQRIRQMVESVTTVTVSELELDIEDDAPPSPTERAARDADLPEAVSAVRRDFSYIISAWRGGNVAQHRREVKRRIANLRQLLDELEQEIG